MGRFGRKAFLVGATLSVAGLGMASGRASQAFAGPVGDSTTSGASILSDKHFPIGLFWPPPPFETTTKRYQEIVDAGFTFVVTGNYQDDSQILDYLLGITDAVGLQVLIETDPEMVCLTHDFMISDNGGSFTLTSAEAAEALRRVIDQYAGHSYWSIVDGELLVDGGVGAGLGLSKQGADWTDYTFAVDVTPLETFHTRGEVYAQTGWAFRAQDKQNAYAWLLSNYPYTSAKASGYLVKVLYVNGRPSYVRPVPLNLTVVGGQAYHVETKVSGHTFTTTINGALVDTTIDETYSSGRVGFRSDGDASGRFDNVSVTGRNGKVLLSDDFSHGLGQWDPQIHGGHPSFAGLALYDEPTGAKVADIGKWVALMASLGLPYLPYVNLGSRRGSAYTEQAKVLGAPVISFDRYPILKNDVADTGYFQNWSDVRAAALANKIPSWTYIQSVSFNGQAVPTAADLLWQINVSLAYGCQGIQYFTYWTPDPARGQAFRGGIIDVDGTKTPLYAAATQVNHDWLAPVGQQLLGKSSQAVNALNLTKPPAGLPPISADDPVISHSQGDAAFVGRFGDGSPHQWLLVGNYSNTHAAAVQPFLTERVKVVEIFDPTTASYQDTGKARNYHLDPGAAVLLRFTTST